jgi:segregation and condensation protein A
MEEAEKEVENKIVEQKEIIEHPSHVQVYSIITGKDPSWQAIIYELVSSEQLDPWNIDIAVLCRKYFQRINELELGDFRVSSKLLLAAALLLRIKSDILLHRYIRDIDNVLFNRQEKEEKIVEKIYLDEGEIPILSPKTPLPRFKKVTLQELINALDVAIKTESRRINKELEKKQAERLSHVDIPKFKTINIKDRIRHFYARLLTAFKGKKGEIRLPYSDFTGNSKEEKLSCFLPMLHLSNTGKVWLEQEKHYSEIYLYLYEMFHKTNPDHDKDLMDTPENIERLRRELELAEMESEKGEDEGVGEIGKQESEKKHLYEELEGMEKELNETEKQERVEEINSDFENPLGDLISK